MNEVSQPKPSRIPTTIMVLFCAVILLQLGILLQRHLHRPTPAPVPDQRSPALSDAGASSLEDPFLHMRRMQHQIDSLFAAALQNLDRQPPEFDEGWTHLEITPGFGIQDTDSAYEIAVHLPGMDKSNIHVNLQDSILAIVVTQNTHTATTTAAGKTVRRSSQSSRFERHLRLPDATDKPAEVKAAYENGILKVTVPKRPPSETATQGVIIK